MLFKIKISNYFLFCLLFLLNILRLVNDQNNESRHVKFDHIQETDKVSKLKDFRPFIETIDNELEMIRTNLKNNLLVNENVNEWLEQIYAEDLDEAKGIKKSEIEKISKSSDLTNQLFLNALDTIENPTLKNQKPQPKLLITSSSRSKGVLLPRSKSLVNFSLTKHSSSNGG